MIKCQNVLFPELVISSILATPALDVTQTIAINCDLVICSTFSFFLETRIFVTRLFVSYYLETLCQDHYTGCFPGLYEYCPE